MPENFEIREFLRGHLSEVKNMCLTEYNEAETMEMFKQEAREEGMSILVANMLNDGRTIEEVADICHLSHERVKDVADNLAKHLF